MTIQYSRAEIWHLNSRHHSLILKKHYSTDDRPKPMSKNVFIYCLCDIYIYIPNKKGVRRKVV